MDGAIKHQDDPCKSLHGLRVGFVGRLAAMSRRDAIDLVRRQGGIPIEPLDAEIDLIVAGGDELPLDWQPGEQLDERLAAAAARGQLEVIGEAEFWRRTGLIDDQKEVRQLYTPAMLADLAGVPVATVRRWHSRGLIIPVQQVHRLPYFDFREVQTARRLAQLLAAGVAPQAIERKLANWRRYLPQVERPLAQLAIIVQGKDLLLRSGDGLLEAGGQRRFDFDRQDESAAHAAVAQVSPATLSPGEMLRAAEDLDADGQLREAAEMYRAALAAAGPDAETCFRLAELLYRLGEPEAARERYYMALEIDEEYVEARANLGCVLLEQGQLDLAIAAFEGALARHPDYADVHFQLARALDEAGRQTEALDHWQAFLTLAPGSPWAELARQRLDSN
jgi:tetratricopeptide (TPR) repeat protein